MPYPSRSLMQSRPVVLSLYDLTGEAVRPWAEAGYHCHIFDIQHPKSSPIEYVGDHGGAIVRCHADLHKASTLFSIADMFKDANVVFHDNACWTDFKTEKGAA
ncbi:hypothetical protein XMM379_003134 [Aliiroseovarius sp. xm-m-379]|nr:hypothetical protein [Aliiroseovarius sp. xm-m-379]NRP58420.1 hypothetical protein [Marinobacterium sp. xm-d-510]